MLNPNEFAYFQDGRQIISDETIWAMSRENLF